MIRNYYSILHSCNEFKYLEGCQLVSTNKIDENNITMFFDDGDEIKTFCLLIGTNHDIIFRSDNSFRKGDEIFQIAKNDILQKIQIIEGNRVICLEFIKHNIFIELFGGLRTKLILTNKNLHILQQFTANPDSEITNSEFYKIESNKHISDFLAMKLNQENAIEYLNFLKNQLIEKFQNRANKNNILNEENLTLDIVLEKTNFVLSEYYINSFKITALKYENYRQDYIVKSNLAFDFLSKLQSFINEILNSKSCFTYQINSNQINSNQTNSHLNQAIVFSIISLHQAKELGIELSNEQKHESFLDTIRKIAFTRLKIEKINKLKIPLLKEIEARIKKNENLISKISDKKIYQDRLDKYKLYADLLMSSNQTKIKGLKSIQITDWESNNHIIELDDKKTIIDNAQRYYSKVGDINKELKINQSKLPSQENQLSQLKAIKQEVEQSNSEKELLKQIEKINLLFRLKLNISPNKSKEKDQSTRFRKFEIEKGLILYVGKDSASNDYLTVRFAKAHDMWFHAKGVSGSHCVLRLNKNQKVQKASLEKSAAIAAYYSQARNQKHIPVIYTFKKYVHKPKGANLGAVVVQKEDIIFVEAEIPEQNNS